MLDGYFDAEHEGHCLHQLLSHDYSHSIYGTASQSNKEIKQREKIRLMEENHRKELDLQKSELEL